MASLFSHNIGLLPIVRHGSSCLAGAVVPGGTGCGERIAALAITEPGGGTDVSALKTTARARGDEYVIDGEKSSSPRACALTGSRAAVRTDPQNKGQMGISMVVVPGDAVRAVAQPAEKNGLAVFRYCPPAL